MFVSLNCCIKERLITSFLYFNIGIINFNIIKSNRMITMIFCIHYRVLN